MPRCGHTMCADCAVRTWLREALKAPRHQHELGLTRTTCPRCRQPYPKIATKVTQDHAGQNKRERCPSSLPFFHNVDMDTTISDIYQDLQIAVQELRAEIPKDDQVEEWIEKYGSVDATEIRDHIGRVE